tara:strand:- start:469 stop:990 length:522 start_codon:yes stop_codon:yes gene_type:complete
MFTGLSLGTVFVIYSPLDPYIYSIGGIALAIATMAIATLYNRLIKVEYFYFISICVEIVILIIVLAVLIFSLNPTIAAIVYTGYQLTFFFGSYLVRCETLLLESKKFLSKVDILKQLGYLAGLATSYVMYKWFEYYLLVTENNVQVYLMHYGLLVNELIVILALYFSFNKKSS